MKPLYILFFLSASYNLKAQKFALFDGVQFDSTTSIVGFPSSTNPELNKNLAFIINTKEGFEQLKKDWVFQEKAYGKKPDNSLAVYVIKNKTGDWIGTIYLSLSKLTTINGSYVFDTMKILDLAKKHPFHFRKTREVFRTRDEYLKAYNKAMQEKNYLFSSGPGSWDGQFKITIPSSDSIRTPVAAISMLSERLSKTAPPDSYSLRYELKEDNHNLTRSFYITVDCLQAVYDKYNDPIYVKSGWIADQISMTSFWKD